jgi:hypothetical protein
MYKRLVTAVAAILAAATLTTAVVLPAFAQAPATPQDAPTVVTPPRHLSLHRHFSPDASASGSRLVWIAHQEQRKIGGPSIVGRMSCESGLGTNMIGTGHAGVLQWDSTFYSMYAAAKRIYGRGVNVIEKRTVKKPVTAHYADGTTQRTGTVRQHQTIHLHGMLPKQTTPWNAWAAVRTGQAAAAGKIPSTYWACVASNGSHY